LKRFKSKVKDRSDRWMPLRNTSPTIATKHEQEVDEECVYCVHGGTIIKYFT